MAKQKDWKRVRGYPGLYLRFNGSYAVRFKHRGFWYSEAAGRDIEAAKDQYHDLRRRARLGARGLLDNGRRVKDVQDAYLDHCRQTTAPRTLRQYSDALARILPWLGADRVNQLSPALVDKYVADRLKTASRRTVNIELGVLKAMLNYGVSRDLCASNPVAEVHQLSISRADTRTRRALDHEEFARLLDHTHSAGGSGCGAVRQPCRCRELWLVLGHTGMRAGELTGLEWADVDLSRFELHVRGTKTAAADRMVPMTSAVAEMLTRRLWRLGLEGRQPTGLVFTTRNGGSLRWNLWLKLQTCLEAAGIDPHGVDVHALRYSFTSWLIQAGQSPKTVQRLLGHSTVQMTLRVYAQILPGDERRAMQVLDGTRDTEAADFHKGFTSTGIMRKIIG